MTGWISWSGGECPVHGSTYVHVTYRSGLLDGGAAAGFNWHKTGGKDDILQYATEIYRPREPDKQDSLSPLHTQHGGDHYRKLKIQPIEYIQANNLGFHEGNVLKYITRWRDKNGIEDLRKAVHYLELLIEHAEKNG